MKDDLANRKRGLGKGLSELLSATRQVASAQESPEKNESTQREPINDVLDENTQPQNVNHGGGEHSDEQIAVPTNGLSYLLVSDIQGGPFQPRTTIRHEGIEQLAESIRTQGVIQPIVVRAKASGQYEIIAGERRWRASQLAGLTEIPAIIKDIPDNIALAIALIENIQRENLNPLEEAKALKRLADEMNLTHLDVAEAVGKSRAAVTNLMRLLSLTPEVQKLVEQGQLEMGHARALLAVKGIMQYQLAQSIVARDLSVRETERIIARFQDESIQEEGVVVNATKDPNISRLERNLADRLGAPVAIRHTRKGKGTVVIRYNDMDELEGILSHMGHAEQD